MATAKSVIQTLGSLAAATMVARTIINDFLPHELHGYLFSTVQSFFSRRFFSNITLIINEFDGLESNHVFKAAELYLGALTKSSAASSANRLQVSKSESEKTIHVAVDQNEEIVDKFQGVKFTWVLERGHVEGAPIVMHDRPDMNCHSATGHTARAYFLTFRKKHKDLALGKYLTHVLDRARVVKQETKTVKLFTVSFANLHGAPSDIWTSANLNHPATFETLAMDPELKKTIVDDLDRFVGRKDYYRRVGRAWKRGYLLYGPPGTGKSSLIAAMANHLNFNIYDLQLGQVNNHDWDLRKILMGIGNQSIIVVEDIDCSFDFNSRGAYPIVGGLNRNKITHGKNISCHVTLSRLLNFIDGLWSSCGNERIMVFTTNHKDKLDPTLLRPGRMDMLIHMSHCTASGFKVLARNYLGVSTHGRFEEIERLIEAAQATPADVAEQLIKHDEPGKAMSALAEFLMIKVKEKMS